MTARKIIRAMEMVQIEMGKAEITRALGMTNADWRTFFKEYGDEFDTTFTDIKESAAADKRREVYLRNAARALRPADFIKLTEAGIENIKTNLAKYGTNFQSGNAHIPFDVSMEILPYAMRANNGMLYATIRAKAHSGYKGDANVALRFPNSFVYLFGYGEIVGMVPSEIALKACKIKLTGALDRPALSANVETMVNDAFNSDIIIRVTEQVKFTSVYKAIDKANESNGLHIDKALFLNERVNSSFVTVRANPEGPLEGTFIIRTKVQK